MGPNDFLVVYGPRHDVAGKATYTNVNVYASEKVMFSMASIYPTRSRAASTNTSAPVTRPPA